MSLEGFLRTSVAEKAVPSFINAGLVILLTTPLLVWGGGSIIAWKATTVVLFLVYNLYFATFYSYRCLGMHIVGTHWKNPVTWPQRLLHATLYTLSFFTLFVWVSFPFDLFLVNMLLQYACIKLTGTTIHGYISGITSVRERSLLERIREWLVLLPRHFQYREHRLERELWHQASRYYLVSVATLAVNLLLVYYGTEALGLHYLVAVALGLLVATLASYLVNRAWTFSHPMVRPAVGYVRAVGVAVSVFAIVVAVTWLGVEHLGMHYLAARAVAAVLAGIWSYLLDARYTYGVLHILRA